MNSFTQCTTFWLCRIVSVSSILLIGLTGCGGGGGGGSQSPSVSGNPTEVDTSYGTQGQVTFPVGVKLGDGGAGPAILQADGKLIVAGWRETGTLSPATSALNLDPRQIYVLRLNGDGSLDTTFGIGGETRFTVKGRDTVSDIKLQQDGKILLAGNSIEPCTLAGLFFTAPCITPTGEVATSVNTLIRLTPQGTLDATFGGTGNVQMAATTTALTLAAQPDGKILFLRSTGIPRVGFFGWNLVRYNSNGTPDSTFSQVNPTNSQCIANGESMIVQADGKIIVGGPPTFNSSICLVRLNVDGSHDVSFASGTTGTRFDNNQLRSLSTLPNGGLLAVSSGCDATVCGVALARYDADGLLDTSFGASGIATAVVDKTFIFNKHELTPSGDVLIFGYLRPIAVAGQPQQYQPVWIRLDVHGQPASGFGVNGIIFGTSDTKQPQDFVRDSEGRWLVIYTSTLSDGNLGLVVTRFVGERL